MDEWNSSNRFNPGKSKGFGLLLLLTPGPWSILDNRIWTCGAPLSANPMTLCISALPRKECHSARKAIMRSVPAVGEICRVRGEASDPVQGRRSDCWMAIVRP